MAAVHDVWIHSFFTESEKLANARNDSGKSMVDLLDNIRADRKLSTAAHWDDSNKIRDGIMARAPQEMSNYASQWRVKADELEAKTAEMTNAAGNSIPSLAVGSSDRCSLLHRRCTTPFQTSQVRFLFHTLCQFFDFLLIFPAPALDQYGQQSPATGVERQA